MLFYCSNSKATKPDPITNVTHNDIVVNHGWHIQSGPILSNDIIDILVFAIRLMTSSQG